ncbi:hypothetical protein SAMN04487996_107125 [Dyadobacter soli]|uniref:Uncharacterized protein n=1 Tax=Dyadobacter soli TaxID=659014 RepID=A0A1G7G4Z0_9BACT|nr:hypothetical protein [Dyadobacter soli]SDE83191.1 hypothetical protein SAMN04487996_107125 [Dyadobacter soli]
MKKEQIKNLFLGQRVWVINKQLPGTIFAVHDLYGSPKVDIMLDPHRIFKNGKRMYLASPGNLNVSPYIEGQTIRVDDRRVGLITEIRPSVNGRFWYTTRPCEGASDDDEIRTYPSHECNIEAVTKPVFNITVRPLINFPPSTPDWESKLIRKTGGRPEGSISNHLLILQNDSKLAGKIAFNRLTHCEDVIGELPWKRDLYSMAWNDTDRACLRHYLGVKYKISSRGLEIAFSVSMQQYAFHPVKDAIRFEPI